MEIPFDKIKVNNAVVVFFIIVTCVCCPLTLLLAIDYKLFLGADLTKLIISIVSIGCTQFAFFYVGNSIAMRLKFYKDDGPLKESMVNFLIQNPLINTSLSLILFYGLLITIADLAKLTLDQAKHILTIGNFGLIIGNIFDVFLLNQKAKRMRKAKDHTTGVLEDSSN